jgi:hypothetical protein
MGPGTSDELVGEQIILLFELQIIVLLFCGRPLVLGFVDIFP